MSTQIKDGPRPDGERDRERSVSEVAREAFRNRVMEGDRPDRKRPRDEDRGPT